jgi:hypothetical protein
MSLIDDEKKPYDC